MRSFRTPNWNGAFNLFDLGGLALVGGGTTVYGRVFRSGRTESMTEQGWVDLGAVGVSTVIDLRNESERVRRPEDPVVREVAFCDVVFASTPTEDPESVKFQELCGPWLDHPHSYPDNLRLFPSKIVRVFEALAAAPDATLVHCSGGRDRTGLIAALLLRLAGVELTAIADDYAEAFRVASRHVTRTAEVNPEQVNEHPYTDEETETRIRERAEVLVEWLDGLDVAAWLSTAGLAERDLRAVRSRLLPT